MHNPKLPNIQMVLLPTVDLIDRHRQSMQLFFMQVFLLHWKFKKV